MRMRITRTADYGVRVMTQLAGAPDGSRLTVAELAGGSQASAAFTGKILQRLAAANLVVSHRGYDGGFELARPATSITVLDVVQALDGTLCLNDCVPGGPGCERMPTCLAQGVWKRAQDAVVAVLQSESLDRLVGSCAAG